MIFPNVNTFAENTPTHLPQKEQGRNLLRPCILPCPYFSD
jgi:hypothetical protein